MRTAVSGAYQWATKQVSSFVRNFQTAGKATDSAVFVHGQDTLRVTGIPSGAEWSGSISIRGGPVSCSSSGNCSLQVGGGSISSNGSVSYRGVSASNGGKDISIPLYGVSGGGASAGISVGLSANDNYNPYWTMSGPSRSRRAWDTAAAP